MIIVDIDGVVADSEPWLVKEIEERSGVKLRFDNPRTFDFLVNTNIDLKDGLRYIDDALIKYKDDITVHNHIRTTIALRMIQAREGSVNFVTARHNGEVAESTHYWLDKNFKGITYNLHSLGVSANKFRWMYDNNAYAIVDDRLKTANDIPSCYKSYLVEREWNIGRHTEPHVKRVRDLLSAVQDYFGRG